VSINSLDVKPFVNYHSAKVTLSQSLYMAYIYN